MRSVFIALLLVLGSGLQAAFAQAPRLAPGSRVRVSVAGQSSRLVGIVQERSPDSLVVALPSRDGRIRTVPMDQLTKLETWGKRPNSVGKAWAKGTGAGALAGMLIGLAVKPPCEGSGWCIGPQDQGDMIGLGVLSGAVLGGLIGAIVGAANRDGWVKFDLPVIRPEASRTGVRMSWSLPLPPAGR